MILDQYSSYLAFLGILGYCRFFVMIHICYFYHRNVFDNKVFFMFHKSGDNIMIYALMGFPRIAVVWYRCFWWRFWRCRFSVDYLRLDTTEILILSGERLIKSSSSPCWFFLSIAFSSGTLKRLSYKIVKIFIVWYFELCRVFCGTFVSLITAVVFILKIFVIFQFFGN